MKVKLENPGMFSKIIEIISDLVTEVKIRINEEGLSINAIDPANVAMIGFKIPKQAFSEFEVDNDSLGINLDDLKRILKRVSANSSLILKREENLLIIELEDRIKRRFSLNLIDIDTEEKEIPDLEFSSEVELNSVDFISSIEDCNVVADACSFIINEKKFIIESKGINSARAEFSEDEAKISAENCKSRYSLEYLQKFAKASKLWDKTQLKFANEHPLKMNIRTPNIQLSFLLAPRVETED